MSNGDIALVKKMYSCDASQGMEYLDQQRHHVRSKLFFGIFYNNIIMSDKNYFLLPGIPHDHWLFKLRKEESVFLELVSNCDVDKSTDFDWEELQSCAVSYDYFVR